MDEEAGPTKGSSPLTCGHGAVSECRIGEGGTPEPNGSKFATEFLKRCVVEEGEAEPNGSNVTEGEGGQSNRRERCVVKEGEPGKNGERRNPAGGLSKTDAQKHGGGDRVPFRSSALCIWGYGSDEPGVWIRSKVSGSGGTDLEGT